MSIRKRKGSDIWHFDIRTPDGGRVRQSSGTTNRKEAQEYHDKLKHELWLVARLGKKQVRTFDEAALRILKEQAGTVDYTNKKIHLRHFRTFFEGRSLDSITRDEIFAALPEYCGSTKKLKPTSNTTKNRYLGTMRNLLNTAVHEWEWIDKAPKLSELKTVQKRIRWINRDEAIRLIGAITSDWMRDVTVLGFATGLRQANLLGLEWSQVDLAKRRAWIHPDQAKARKPIGVPLNAEAVAVIRRWIGKHETHVFVRKGEPVTKWDLPQWNRACARAGIVNFRFHDVRHTWASWHVQGGTPLNRLMELGGWSKYEMVLRYAHLAPDHLAPHADAVTIWAQNGSDFSGTAAIAMVKTA
ncbi:tyrosine-type recombinase/integrase [Paraburkholderia xenovorans]|uniref:tyrosine-type recombinase/integrase n=1 Tax=Paraburkholderia xenovorans TaxID=36873 RepID=UPI001558710A|nr:site-specific integrase [Paraburkholderia xenovorans]NPT36220.1 tyrosine-type recombinase/integrase [Paraburkholderia xenovorans]